MKTKDFIATAIFFISILFVSQAFAQKEVQWVGGFPGQEQDWFCPHNWAGDRLPDEFSNVIIPDVSTSTFANPVIGQGEEVSVNSLFIESNAALTVQEGSSLTVFTYLTSVNDKSLEIKGDLQILESHLQQQALAYGK